VQETFLRDLSVAVLACQEHAAKHTDTCFKTKQTCQTCRSGYPKKPNELNETRYNQDTRQLEYARPIGNNQINFYNSDMMAALLCNHDIKHLPGGASAGVWLTCSQTAVSDSR
jgi:hypothetical protein